MRSQPEVRDRVTLFHLSATVKIFLHWGCEGVYSHWLVDRDLSVAWSQEPTWLIRASIKGPSIYPQDVQGECEIFTLIYEDPLGCAIASSWNWSENNFLYVFLGNDIIWISRYLDGKTCLSASGAGAAGVSAALSLDPYKIIMNILAQKA